jgi:DNA repair exonuclease SbcCD ATPase subunit
VCSRNQILLRLASVELLDSDGREIEFAIKRVLAVNEPSKANKTKVPNPSPGGFTPTFPGAAELQQLQVDLHNQREDIKRIDSNGFRIVSALDKRADRIQGDVTKLRGSVPSIQRDIGALQQELGLIKVEIGKARASSQNSTALAGLEDRLTSVTSTVKEVGEQLATLNDQFQKEVGELRSELGQQQQEMEDLRSEVRGSVSVADHAQDMVNLRAEMAQLRRQMDENRAHETTRAHTAFPPRELEVATGPARLRRCRWSSKF